MKAQQIIHKAAQIAQDPLKKKAPVDNYVLLGWLEDEINDLLSAEDWSWSIVHLDPIAKTVAGKRSYLLPANFGSNFVHGSGHYHHGPVCKISDGASESWLDYKTPGALMGADFTAATNGRPSAYTILTNAAGRREIVLDPPPDSRGYTLRGAYRPSHVSLDSMDELPPLPSYQILEYGILRRLLPDSPFWLQRYTQARNDLYRTEALTSGASLFPNVPEDGREYWR